MSNKEQQEPRVGIFWFFQRMLILDTTPLSKAEAYGRPTSGHATSHVDYWAGLQRKRLVPSES